MSFSSDWDIDYYKTDYESDEHWELRKSFMEAHKDKFPENELVCLAQVFANVEFMGCRYPAKTMERVAHLSRDVAKGFRESRESKLKRTFVGASDAAGAKAKRISLSATLSTTNTNKQHSMNLNQPSTSTNNNNKPTKRKTNNDGNNSDEEAFKRPSFSYNSQSMEQKTSIELDSDSDEHITTHAKKIPDTGFIIFETLTETNDLQILHTSAAKQGTVIKFQIVPDDKNPNNSNAVVLLNNNIYASIPFDGNKAESKNAAYIKAMEYAKQIHYTIRQKNDIDKVEVECQNDDTKSNPSNNSDQLPTDNKGFKMMKLLGWTGGALGTTGDGIKEPINIEVKIDRRGLGLSSKSAKLDYKFFEKYLIKYKSDETATYDLVFSPEFDKDERKTLHEIANRLSLKSRSRNDESGGRYLVIRKKIRLIELANDIFNGGLQSKYYVLIPPTKSSITNSIEPPTKDVKNSNFNYQEAIKKYKFLKS